MTEWTVRIHSPGPNSVVECVAEFKLSGFTVTEKDYHTHPWQYVLTHYNKHAMMMHVLTHGDRGFTIKEGTL